ncbi:MAG: hypothetical protein JF592_12210 [Microbacterium sp.]|uniref:hypothetical protein n=1 Tax=Microbacterium sp. TaxID=51671 RepID=UPI001D474658|nr:hypothetical protein [Microbacterium sp.]MBW8763332.1 hypothetical protein [Microbacterium sp.]
MTVTAGALHISRARAEGARAAGLLPSKDGGQTPPVLLNLIDAEATGAFIMERLVEAFRRRDH